MSATDALREGRLGDALALQDAVVRDCPNDPAARLFLVELLTLAGRYKEAWQHLSIITSDDPGWPAARRSFRRLLRCEWRRERAAKPVFLTDPPAHARARWRLCRALAWGDLDAATAWADRADAASPHLQGHIDGREFDGLRDADDRFASVLELFAGQDYAWVPWEHVRRLTLHPAQHVLDRAFRPAQLRLVDGPELEVLVPLLYPGSHAADDAFALGLESDRADTGDGLIRGIGGKLLLTGEEEILLGACRQIDVRG